ncbi:MAG: NAD(P)H-hydrate dehydratase [Candidatus Eisenbacteria bacterium]|nr:NAD(P)H-hydrate dehydratase [Candidatus Eisenbacteria bacterium]
MEILSPEEMRETDRVAIEEMGIPSLDLMECAGSAVGRAIRERVGMTQGRVVVLCGKGNNGGDGMVVARWLSSRGQEAEVILFCRGEDLRGDAAVNYALLRDLPVPLHELPDDSRDSFAAERIAGADLLVDALLGTGFAGAPRGRVAEAIRLTHRWPGMIVALDVPSGVNGANGAVEGDVVRADWTVTLCRPKQGLYLYPGREYAGRIVTVPIGIPADALARVGPKTFLFDEESASPLIRLRRRDAHKGNFGRILIAGGSPCLTGAPLLAGRAALRSGAGLVTLGVPSSLQSLYAARVMELMTLPLADREGTHTGEGARIFLDDPGRFDTLAVGPGFGRGGDQEAFVDEVLARWEGPVVFDADALRTLAGKEDRMRASRAKVILTPHLGELEAMTGATREAIVEDRIGFVRRWAERVGAILVLKGNPTLVADPEGYVSLNTTGNPGMATAGSGDVLTGIVAALLGTGLGAADAARLGVWLHGRAGDLAAGRKGEAGMIAGDLVEALPATLHPLEKKAGLER